MLRKLRKRRRAGWYVGDSGEGRKGDNPLHRPDPGFISGSVMSLRERTRPGLGIIEPCLPSPAEAWPSGPGYEGSRCLP